MADQKELIARLKADNRDLLKKLKQAEKECNSLKNVGKEMGAQIGSQLIGAGSKSAILVKGIQSIGKILDATFGHGIAIKNLEDDLTILSSEISTQESLWKSWQSKVNQCKNVMTTLEKVGNGAADLSEKQAVLEKSVKILRSAYGDLGITLDETTGKYTGLDGAQQKIARKNAEEAIRHQESLVRSLKKQIDIQRELYEKNASGIKSFFNGEKLLKISLEISKTGDQESEAAKVLAQLKKDYELLTATQEADTSDRINKQAQEEKETAIETAETIAEAEKKLDQAVFEERKRLNRNDFDDKKSWLSRFQGYYNKILSGFGFKIKDDLNIFSDKAMRKERQTTRLDARIQEKIDKAQESGKAVKLTKKEKRRVAEYYRTQGAINWAQNVGNQMDAQERFRQRQEEAIKSQQNIQQAQQDLQQAQGQQPQPQAQAPKQPEKPQETKQEPAKSESPKQEPAAPQETPKQESPKQPEKPAAQPTQTQETQVQPVVIPIAPIEPVEIPIAPIEPITIPVNPVETVSIPVEPVDTVKIPIEDVETVSIPVDPVDTVSIPVEPVETVTIPVETVDTVKIPIEDVETVSIPVDPVETVSIPIDPVETVSIPIDPVETVSIPIEPVDTVTIPVNPVDPVEIPIKPVDPVTIPVETPKVQVQETPKQPETPKQETQVEPVSIPVNPVETVTIPVNPVETVTIPVDEVEPVTIPVKPVDPVEIPVETPTVEPVEIPVETPTVEPVEITVETPTVEPVDPVEIPIKPVDPVTIPVETPKAQVPARKTTVDKPQAQTAAKAPQGIRGIENANIVFQGMSADMHAARIALEKMAQGGRFIVVGGRAQ